jgi:hypothetical protein
VPTSPDGRLRFHLGEPIKVKWEAPLSHSRRDWIGIYRVRALLNSGILDNIDPPLMLTGWRKSVQARDEDILPWHVGTCPRRRMGR